MLEKPKKTWNAIGGGLNSFLKKKKTQYDSVKMVQWWSIVQERFQAHKRLQFYNKINGTKWCPVFSTFYCLHHGNLFPLKFPCLCFSRCPGLWRSTTEIHRHTRTDVLDCGRLLAYGVGTESIGYHDGDWPGGERSGETRFALFFCLKRISIDNESQRVL